MRRLRFALLVFAVAAGCAGTSGQHTPAKPVKVAEPVPGSTKLYVGPDGIEVSMVRLADDTVLLRVTGTQSVVDGLVLPYEFRSQGGELQVYVTQIDGRDHWVVHVRQRAGSAPTYQLYLPGKGYQGVPLDYDEKRSKEVDGKRLAALHAEQVAAGTLDRLQRFDRKAAEQRGNEALAAKAGRASEACGVPIKVEVQWSSIDDPTLKKYSVSGYCSAPVDALRQLCGRSSGAKRLIAGKVKAVSCRFGEGMKLERQGDRLRWSTGPKAVNQDQFARKALLESIDWGTEHNLAARLHLDAVRLCHDGKGNYVGWRPEGELDKTVGGSKQVFYGDGKSFTRVPTERWLGDGWFFDPRHFKPSHNRNFRGMDLRYYSFVKVDGKAQSCKLACGEREWSLKLMSAKEAERLVLAGKFSAPVPRRRPYGLARDRRGIYYYVDVGMARDAKDFRLWVGPKAALKRKQMINIVRDSEGDVFATRSGKLRLVLEKEHSFWIRGKRPLKLINVPIPDNLGLIYNELGVYLGDNLGTPCDQF